MLSIFLSLAVLPGALAMDASLVDRYFLVLGSNPASEQAAERLWQMYSAEGRVGDLIQRTRGLAEGDPRLSLPLADFFARAGNATEAGISLGKAPLASMGPQALLRAGEIWKRIGDPAAAASTWDLAAEHAPADFGLRARIAEACIDAGDPAAAEKHWLIIAGNADPASRLAALEEITDLREAAGDYAKAADAAGQALNFLSRTHWKAPLLTKRLIVLADRAGTLDALEEQWIGMKGGDRAIRLAMLAAHRGDSASRARWLREAVASFPDDFSLLRDLAALELSLGNLQEAEKHARAAQGLRPDDEAAVERLAEILALGGREEEASSLIEGALNKNPLHRKEELFRRLNLRAALEKSLRSACDANPGSPDAAFALAEFLHESGRLPEARTQVLAIASGHNETLAVISRAARFLFDTGFAEEARDPATKALETEPANPSHALLVTQILTSLGDDPGAMKALREATEKMSPPPEDLDRQLFDLMQRSASSEAFSLRNLHSGRHTRALLQAALADPSEARTLRAARWAAWSDSRDEAVACLRLGISSNPNSAALQEALAAQLEALGSHEQAITSLARLRVLQPDAASAINRRIARLETTRGNPEAAVATLAAEWSLAPGDWELARELALAHQAAGNYFEALEKWSVAADTAPPNELHGILRPVIACFSRLSLASRGLEFLDKQAARLPEGRLRIEWLRAGTIFAKENNALPEWTSRLESRRAAEPSAPSWNLALVEAGITPPESLPSPMDEKSIEAALTAAEASKDFPSAALLAEKLTRGPEASLESFQRHAHLLEAAGKLEEASQAWDLITLRFARSGEAQADAASFHKRAENPTKEIACWRASSLLGPVPPWALLLLGRSAFAGGDRERAVADFSNLVSRVPPSPEKNALPFPLPSRLQSAQLPSETDPQGCRLIALRELGKLLANSPQAQEKLTSLAGRSPLDRAWIFSAARLAGPALDTLEPLAAENAAAAHSFILLCMEFGEFGRLKAWLEESLPGRWEVFLATIPQMLEAGWRPGPTAVEMLFADAPPFASVQFAGILAGAGMVRAAIGMEIPDRLTGEERAEALFRLAGWQLAIREPEAASLTLQTMLESTLPTGSLEEPFFAALRALWLLTGDPNKQRLEEHILARLEASPPALHLSRLLFAALRNQRSAFRREAAAWLDMAPQFRPPDGGLHAVAREGAQLERWNLPLAERDLFRISLEHDAALAALNGDSQSVTALEAAILSSRLAEAGPEEARFLASEWHARGASLADLAKASAKAVGSGRIASARVIAEHCFLAAPTEPQVWTQLLSLASLPEGFSEVPSSWFLAAPTETRAKVPAQSIQLLTRGLASLGRRREAMEILSARTTGGDPGGRLALEKASLLIDEGRSREAAGILEKTVFSPENSVEASRLKVRMNPARKIEGLSPSERLVHASPESAREALSAFLSINPSPISRLGACEQLLDSNTPAISALNDGEAESLIEPARDAPGLAARYYMARHRIAGLRGTTSALVNEMSRLRDAGDPLAVEILLRIAVDTEDTGLINTRIDEFLASNNVGHTAIEGLAKTLVSKGRHAEAARVFARLDEDGIMDHALALAYAEALWKSGRREEAIRIADSFAMAAKIDPSLHTSLAAFHLSVGRPDAAIRHLDAPGQPGNALLKSLPLREQAARMFAARVRPDGQAD